MAARQLEIPHVTGLNCETLLAGSGSVEPRPGVIRLYEEAREAGLKVAVCSAATKSSVILVLENLLGPERFEVPCRLITSTPCFSSSCTGCDHPTSQSSSRIGLRQPAWPMLNPRSSQ